MRKLAITGLCGILLAGPAGAADYVLSIEDTGKRDYYCQIMVALENRTDTALTEISGHFFSFVGAEQVGRSKGAWFMNVAPGGRAEATFETPNAPCAAVERYTFVVGACRLAAGFEPQVVCAERMSGGTVIDIVAPAD
jgi:hypothetical protein